MKIVRAFLSFLFLGAWTAFMVVVAVTLGAVLRDPGYFRRAQRFWAKALLRFWGVTLEVHGAENMDVSRSYIVMSNHGSYADIVVLFLALPIIPGFLAKRELTKIPFLSQALRSGGHVLIDRGQRASAMQTIQGAAEQVRGGKTVLIFPEGTRGDSDTVGELKKGGFHLARAAQVPIVPVGVRGSRAVFPRGTLLIRSGHVEVHIGKPISEHGHSGDDLAPLVAQVRREIITLSAMPAREAAQASPAPA